MTHCIALIHKEPKFCYGVSFPDVPGIVTAGETLDEAIAQAADVLAFAAEDWEEASGQPFPNPRTREPSTRSAPIRHLPSSRGMPWSRAIPFPDQLRRAA